VLIFPTVIFRARVFGLQSPTRGCHLCSSFPHWGLAHFSTESSTGAGIFHLCFFCSRSEASIPACVTAVQIGVDFRGAPPYRGLLPADPRELGTRLSSLSHIFPAVKRAVLA
jgi:hypothetical protein